MDRRALRAALTAAFPGCPIGARADDLVLRRLSVGDLLCEAGDPASGAWLVVDGWMRALRPDDDGGPVTVLGDAGPGTLIGEAGLLDDGVRGATVVAHRDALVAELTREWLAAVVSDTPDALGSFVTTLTGRVDGLEVDERMFAIVPTAHTVDDAAALARAMATLPGTHLVSGRIDAVELGRLEHQHERLVLLADPVWNEWTARCCHLADHAAVLVDQRDAGRYELLEEAVTEASRSRAQSVTVVFVHPEDTLQPSSTASALAVRPAGTRHLHLRRHDNRHHERVARLLTGTGVVAVLGGGGARSLAHLGVYRALAVLGIPIDAAVGTSAGAVLAAFVAKDYSPTEAIATARPGFLGVRDHTLPIVGLLKGSHLWKALTDEFGDSDVEDLWKPFGCVSSDMTTGEPAYHSTGELRTAIRASVAVPGVFSPVSIGGDVHVDGGLLDNLPVGLGGRVAPGCLRIAVDASPPYTAQPAHPLPPFVSGLATLGRRLLRRADDVPTLAATVTRAMLLPASRARAEAASAADLYIDLGMDHIGLLDFKHFDQIVDAGEHRAAGPLREAIQEGMFPMTTTIPETATSPAAGALATTSVRAALGALWLAAADLRFRLRRFVVAVVAASVTLMLLLLVTGVVAQLEREPDLTTKTLNAEFWVMRTGVASPFTSSAGVFSDDLAGQVEVDGPINPIFTGSLAYELEGGTPEDALLVGHEPTGPGVPDPVEGVLGADAGEIAVSTEIDAAVGDTMTLAGFEVTVTGRVDNASLFSGMPLIFVPNDVLRGLVGTDRPMISAMLTDTRPTSVPGALGVRERPDVAVAAGAPVERPILSLQIIRVLLSLVAAMIIGAVVYLASVERTRDVAVLRAVGTKGSMLATGVAVQALAIALVASVFANLLSVVVAPVFPMAVHLTAADLVSLPVIAAIVAMAASYIAIRRTLRIDPSEAFAGAGG